MKTHVLDSLMYKLCQVLYTSLRRKPRTSQNVLLFVSCEAKAGTLPRNHQQVKDAKWKDTSKIDFDPLYSVMHMCKEGEGKGGKGGNTFIRMVNAAPYPMMLIVIF